MARLFGRLFGRNEKQNELEVVEIAIPPIAAEKPFAAIGDIHGCDDLLARLLEKLSNEAPDVELLFVGDYIDRGEQSARVLRRLMDFEGSYCLLGNHERMCLDFIDHPEEKGARWLRNGGLQTIASFGVSGATNELVSLRDQMVAAMGDELIRWLRELPLVYENGNIRAVHAAAHPEKPIEGQGEKPLIWGHSKFGRLPRRDGLWVVHGHTIVDVPKVFEGVVSIDTGAYATGRLTAAIFAGNDVQFVQA